MRVFKISYVVTGKFRKINLKNNKLADCHVKVGERMFNTN